MCHICEMLARGGAETSLTFTPKGDAAPDDESLPATRPGLDIQVTNLPDDAGAPGLTDASFAGQSALLAQYFANGVYNFSGNRDIDAVLIGSKWAGPNLTFSFPTMASQYGAVYPEGLNTTMSPFNAAQQAAATAGLAMVASYTNLVFTNITETDTTHATLRFAQTRDSDVPSAQGLFPGDRADAGDVWFGQTNQPFYTTPAAGNWGWATQLHELGHVLGLKHGQDNYTNVDLSDYFGTAPRRGSAALPPAHDGQAWSLMTYRSDPGATVTFQGDGANQPQTYMQNDIAALQYLYGANFTTNATDSTYRWNPTTGEMSINGQGRGAPTANKILSTVWDGGGEDTYDLGNYTGPLTLDLRPGGFSTFSAAQLVNHRPLSGGPVAAIGNVGNALLFQGDVRSLIENAVGGTGNDVITGNTANNRLTGGGGADMLYGLEGDDVLTSGIGGTRTTTTSRSDLVKPQSQANAAMATALVLNGAFDLDDVAQIAASTTTPHATVHAVGHGDFEWYRFTLPTAGTIRLDIDGTTSPFDSYIYLVNSGGTTVAFNDDASADPGSTGLRDSGLTYSAAAGDWYVKVGRFTSAAVVGPLAGTAYTLHVSATSAVVETSTSIGGSTLDGGAGADILNTGPSPDLLYGGDGTDTLNGGAGNDVLYGGQGVDVLSGNQDDDILYGNTENDILYGGQGDDQAFGGQGADTLFGNLGDDLLYGNLGDDVLNGGAGVNRLDGGDGIDTATYSDAAAGVTVSLAMQGAAQPTGVSTDLLLGIENLTGSAFADTLTGDPNANTLSGGAGADTMSGGLGADTLYGNQDNDILSGNQDADVLNGGQGDDTLYGGQGDDLLQGGLGADRLAGNLGIDTFAYLTAADSTPAAFDTITDFVTGQDRIDLRAIRTGSGDTYGFSYDGVFTTLSADLGGNGTIDLKVLVTGVVADADVLWT